MKRIYILSTLFLLLAIGCQESSTEPKLDETQPGTIELSGSIELSGTDGLSILAGFNTGDVESNGTFSVKLNENTVQLVSIVDANDVPLLMSLPIIGQVPMTENISAATTAEALLFLNPFLVTSDTAEAAMLKLCIRNLNSFNSLTQLIESELQNGSFSIDNPSEQFTTLLDQVTGDLFRDLEQQVKARLQKITGDPIPGFPLNGLYIIDYNEQSDQISFKVKNNAKRWINLYLDKHPRTSGTPVVSENLDIIPSPDVSIFDIISGSPIPEIISQEYRTSTTGFSRIDIKGYGLGVGQNLSQAEFERFITPAVMTSVYDLIIPLFEVIFGSNLDAELRGRPTSHPFYRLVEKIIQDILLDPDAFSTLYELINQGNIVSFSVEIATGAYSTAINNPRLISDIVSDIIDGRVARRVIDSFLWPLRLINFGVTAINLGYSFGSIVSSEAVTTFTVNIDSPPVGGITAFGLVLDSDNQNQTIGVPDAVVSVLDENNAQIAVVRTDNLGLYTFNTENGIHKLRIQKEGFIPTNQTISVFGNQSNIYNAPPVQLSRFSNIPGDIGGTVRDATNLTSLDSVQITLRYGLNDSTAGIVAETQTVNGFYQVMGLPAGTYTAFFSREGYFDDFLPIVVVANQTRPYDMNMAPEVADSSYRIVLTWDLSPRDLDSHLFTPPINGLPYHIYYASKGTLTGPPYAELDVDDVTSYGPETITIGQRFSGTYEYKVYQYSSDGNLPTSGGKVTLYDSNGLVSSWNVPTNGNGRWWNVFNIDGDTGAITSINTISSSLQGRLNFPMPEK